jgi:succinate dehydrogenase/fumarate reductase iron-sulfur protein
LSVATIQIQVRRTDENGVDAGYQAYRVPSEPKGTVLQALQDIYSAQDSTLAFRFSCRLKQCGLCAVKVAGRSRLACLSPSKDGLTVEPLNNLPVVRDLVVDRRPLFDRLRELRLYPMAQGKIAKPQAYLQKYYALSTCLECLCCHSDCPAVAEDPSFPGPFLLVKLAQMHFHPRDGEDRREQAKALGIERCRQCRGCSCPYGVNIRRDVISALLG